MRHFAAKALSTLSVLLAFSPGGRAQTFINPTIAHGADPSVVLVKGVYYSVQSGCAHSGAAPVICIRSAATLSALGRATPVLVWTAPDTGPNSREIWAPEIANLGGSWYIYYAASSQLGRNDHKLFALVPRTASEPLEAWVEAPTGAPNGALTTDWKSAWAIDPNVFEASDKRYYLVYSCRQDANGDLHVEPQSICLAGMSDPLTLQANPQTGKKVVELSTPTQPWEIRGFPTEEGPFGFTHDGVDYILFSGSFSGNPDQYSSGLLINNHPPQPNGVGNPLLNPASWIKQGPVFDGHHASYGTASSVLVNSPDGTELWNVYHGTDCLKDCFRVDCKTWRDRSVRAQKAGWSPSGSLVMGYPVDIANTDKTGKEVPLPDPSTGSYGTMMIPAWGDAFGDAAEGNPADGRPVGTWNSSNPASISSTSLDANRFDSNFFGANPNWQNYILRTDVKWIATGKKDPHPKYGVYGAYVDHENYFVAMIDITSCGSPGCLTTAGVVEGAASKWENCPLPASFHPATASTLVVEAVNGTFTAFIDGTKLSGPCQSRQFNLTAGQSPIRGSSGQVGVVVQNTQAQYTGFNVSPGVPLDTTASRQTYAFRSRASRMNLDNFCDGCRMQAAEKIQVIQYPPAAPYPLTTSKTQLWALKDRGDSYFQIASVLSGMCLENPAGNGTSSRTPPPAQAMSVVLWQRTCSTGGATDASQSWRFLPVGDSSFVIENQASSLVLESYDATQGTQVRLATKTGTVSQSWQLILQ